MGKRNQSETSNAESDQVTSVNIDKKSEKPTTYVVVREGFRVSDKEYSDPTDSSAIAEKELWTNIANKHSHREPVEIVKYNSQIHRVW